MLLPVPLPITAQTLLLRPITDVVSPANLAPRCRARPPPLRRATEAHH